MKLTIIIGTRPEIIRLSATIKKAKQYFEVSVVHTGQNYDYELNKVFFKDLELDDPEYYLNCSTTNLGQTVGDVIAKSYELFTEIKPDAILILGDTNSCLCAYSAKRLKIPIFHCEAGNRCYDPNVPEEINRKIIDHLADVNMCYMEHARQNLLAENIKPQYTFVVGSPMTEVISNLTTKINSSNVLKTLNLTKNKYFVWSSHREENINNMINFNKMINSINNLALKYSLPVVFSIHPRTRKMIEQNNVVLNENIIMSKPFGVIDYCCLQQNALCVISDSGTITEESNILNFKSVLLRTSTEHPEGIDSGSITIGNIDWINLSASIAMCLNSDDTQLLNCYEDDNFSDKVCKIIIGYTDIINKFVWNKYQ